MGMQFVCITPCHSHTCRQSRPRVETSYIYVPGSPLLGLTRSTVLAFLSSSLIQYVPLLAQKIRDRPISASRSSITLTASDHPRRIVGAPGGCDFVNEVVIDGSDQRLALLVPATGGKGEEDRGRSRPASLPGRTPQCDLHGGILAAVFAGQFLER